MIFLLQFSSDFPLRSVGIDRSIGRVDKLNVAGKRSGGTVGCRAERGDKWRKG